MFHNGSLPIISGKNIFSENIISKKTIKTQCKNEKILTKYTILEDETDSGSMDNEGTVA